jgi:hypothetical protein
MPAAIRRVYPQADHPISGYRAAAILLKHQEPTRPTRNGKPVVSPLAWRLSYRYPVHLIGEHFRPDEVPAEPTFLIVYRDREDEVRFMTANAVTLRLLQLLEDDRCSGRIALMQIARELGNSNTDALLSSGLETLQQLCGLSVICGVSP